MSKDRLEAFSDGVVAILITIMVIELRVPERPSFEALTPLLPTLLSYLLSFVFLALYWNNHHHLLHTVREVNGRVLWANHALLFFLSLVPFTTAWMGQNHREPLPTALYGLDLLAASVAYLVLESCILRAEGERSRLARAVGARSKEMLSTLGYAAAIALAWWRPWASQAIYVAIALWWLRPDTRIERVLSETEAEQRAPRPAERYG